MSLRARRPLLAVVLVAAAASLVAGGGLASSSAGPAAAESPLIDFRPPVLGGRTYPISYGTAKKLFGRRPSRLTRPIANECRTGVREATWRSAGIRIVFVSRRPASVRPLRDGVRAFIAEVFSGAWETRKGLRLGDSTAKMFRLYPREEGVPISRSGDFKVYQLGGNEQPPLVDLYALFKNGKVRKLALQHGIGCE